MGTVAQTYCQPALLRNTVLQHGTKLTSMSAMLFRNAGLGTSNEVSVDHAGLFARQDVPRNR